MNWGEVPPGWQGTFNWDHAFLFPSGRHVLALKVDGNQEIEETDETNNLRGEQWIWSPYPLAAGNFATRSQPPPP